MVAATPFVFVVALCCAILLYTPVVSGACAGVYPPFVPLPTTTFSYRDMPACCWFSRDTCCGIRDEIYDLASIEQQINDIAARGISDQCYIKLSSLFCFWCDPNTAEFVSTPRGDFNPISTLFLCPSFCDELFFKCFDDLDKIVNDFTQIHTSRQFCEEFILDNFYNDDEDVFPNFRIEVGNEDGRNCMRGIDDDEIETEAGICLPIPSSGLVSSDHVFDPIVFAPSAGSILCVTMTFLVALVSAFVVFF